MTTAISRIPADVRPTCQTIGAVTTCATICAAHRIIAQTITVNAASRAVMERIGLTYVRTFPTSMTGPVEGLEEGEVEYEMTREQWPDGTT